MDIKNNITLFVALYWVKNFKSYNEFFGFLPDTLAL